MKHAQTMKLTWNQMFSLISGWFCSRYIRPSTVNDLCGNSPVMWIWLQFNFEPSIIRTSVNYCNWISLFRAQSKSLRSYHMTRTLNARMSGRSCVKGKHRCWWPMSHQNQGQKPKRHPHCCGRRGPNRTVRAQTLCRKEPQIELSSSCTFKSPFCCGIKFPLTIKS